MDRTDRNAVSYVRLGRANDLFAPDRWRAGVMTTDHAASSRGLPVLVDAETGGALGPMEVAEVRLGLGRTTAWLRWDADRVAAADSFAAFGLPEPPRYGVAETRLRDAVMRAGYQVAD